MANPHNLTPFDSERAKLAAAKSVEVRAAKRLASVTDASGVARRLDELAATFQRDQLGTYAATAAAWLLGEIVCGRIKVRGEDAAALLRAMVDIARLEAGEATSHALHAHIDPAAGLAHLAELRARAAVGAIGAGGHTVSTAAVAVEDGDVVEHGAEVAGEASEGRTPPV